MKTDEEVQVYCVGSSVYGIFHGQVRAKLQVRDGPFRHKQDKENGK